MNGSLSANMAHDQFMFRLSPPKGEGTSAMVSSFHIENRPTTSTSTERNKWSFREHHRNSSSTDTSIDGGNTPFVPKRFPTSLNYLRDISNHQRTGTSQTASRPIGHSATIMGSLSAKYHNVEAIDGRVGILQREIGKFLTNGSPVDQTLADAKARDSVLVELSDLRKLRKEITGYAYPPIGEQEKVAEKVAEKIAEVAAKEKDVVEDAEEGEVVSNDDEAHDEVDEVLTEEEIAEITEYKRIVKFAEDILAGRHPRIKVDPTLVCQVYSSAVLSN
jgi:hypothetical protein